MSIAFIDGLPDLDSPMTVRTDGPSAFLCSPRFLARICLDSSRIEWLVECPHGQLSKSTFDTPRTIWIFGSDLWVGGGVVTQLHATPDGAMIARTHNASTGKQLWERFVPIPEAADWAEREPAWPGAPTEEIYGFIAAHPEVLAVCLFRESRRHGCIRPADNVDVMTLPPYACQTDGIGFDLSTGNEKWRARHLGIRVGIIERLDYTGSWSHDERVGVLDLRTGANKVLFQSPNKLGWPVRSGSLLAVPWCNDREVGIYWIDELGQVQNQSLWRGSGVHTTHLHLTSAGLALQTNDQSLWWLGHESQPLWRVRAKPYIYRVFADSNTVFVGTDGRGGRLFGLETTSGREVLNLKQALGGFGSLAKVPKHEVLVDTFSKSRSYTVPANLLVLSMRNLAYHNDTPSGRLLAPWDHGAICVAGKKHDRLAIVDIRDRLGLLVGTTT